MSIDVSTISTTDLQRALEIKQEIEKLEAELNGLLGDGSGAPATGTKAKRGRPAASANKDAAEKPKKKGGRKKSPLKGRKRPKSPSGPLPPAVLKVLEKSGTDMSISEIYDGLVADGYVFTSPDPKKTLYPRIHSMKGKGVKQVGTGRFAYDAETAEGEKA